MPRRAPPMPEVIMLALVGYFLARDLVGVAAMVATSFHCFLRTGEMLSLTPTNVFLRAGYVGVLGLGWTKSALGKGSPESVTMDCSACGRLLTAAMARCQKAGGPIVGCTPAVFRTNFDEGSRALKAECLQLKPYSLRRGGASHHFRSFGDLLAATYRGRWEAAKTAKIYIPEGDLELMALAIPPDCAHECSLYISRFKARL